MSYLGKELQARRLDAGLSRQDVQRKLRIPASFVEAIEAGTWEILPSSVYSVGFTRTYCEFLGLNPEPYVDAVLSAKHTRWKTLGFSATADPVPPPAWLNDAVVWVTIVFIGILSWASYTAVLRPDNGPSSKSVQAETLNDRQAISLERHSR